MFQVIFCPFFSYFYICTEILSSFLVSYRPHALPIPSLTNYPPRLSCRLHALPIPSVIETTSPARSILYKPRYLPISSHTGKCPAHSILLCFIYEVCPKCKCTDFLFKCLVDSPEITSYLLQSMTLGKLHSGSKVFSTDHSSTRSHFL